MIFGTDKIAVTGALYVFGLDGAVRQVIGPLDRPNNVDVEYGLNLHNSRVDIVAVTERKQRRLRVYAIPQDGGALVDLAPSGLPVLAGMNAESGEPMGISLYRRDADGAIFAIVAPKTGTTTDYLWQYRLDDDGAGKLKAIFVRRFGAFSRRGSTDGEIGEIEGIAVDDELGFVYYSDERYGIRKYHADPDHEGANVELAAFGTADYLGDREGLAIYATGPGKGFILSSDQVEGATRVMLYPREGAPARPNEHLLDSIIVTAADGTDGLDATPTPLPGFPSGLAVLMNSRGRNFQIYNMIDLLRPR